jgi:hypothetical protein
MGRRAGVKDAIGELRRKVLRGEASTDSLAVTYSESEDSAPDELALLPRRILRGKRESRRLRETRKNSWSLSTKRTGVGVWSEIRRLVTRTSCVFPSKSDALADPT